MPENKKNKKFEIPPEIADVCRVLEEAGFEAYLVGGCVRDLLLDQKPRDWDITTNAKPEEILTLFNKAVYENKFGTVAVINENVSDETLKAVEITPYRLEAKYSDKRHPDMVIFSNKLEDDLKRRDFTINAIAYSPSTRHIRDIHNGLRDIEDMSLRTVGDPKERFSEDALRIIRAVRLATELHFTISNETQKAIREMASFMCNISKERIRDEFSKIIMSENPRDGLELAHKLGILTHFLPELEEGIGIRQNQAHAFPVWEHILRTVQHSAQKKFPFHVKLSALFHDIGKPRTREWSNDKGDYTFYGHDIIGARMTEKIMRRLRFPVKLTERVVKMVRNHMFFSDTDKITLSAVRRLVRRVGPENVWDLMNTRVCDRIGTGRPKETPYRLRKYKSMVEEAMRDPISVGMLKINGHKIMEITGEKPGPRLGWILHTLLEEVLDDPIKNTEKYLENRVKELVQLPEKDLEKLGQAGKEKRLEEEEKELAVIRRRHGVR